MAASDGKCSISTILREKKGTVNSLSMLLLIVINCFITLAKGSCNKKSHFFRFRRLRKFRGSTVYNLTDSSYLMQILRKKVVLCLVGWLKTCSNILASTYIRAIQISIYLTKLFISSTKHAFNMPKKIASFGDH